MAFCKLLTVLVLIHNTGGLLGAEVMSSIVGGQDATKGHWPWMVHLNITSDGIKKWRCGGTILNSEWVLTAANCWDTSFGVQYTSKIHPSTAYPIKGHGGGGLEPIPAYIGREVVYILDRLPVHRRNPMRPQNLGANPGRSMVWVGSHNLQKESVRYMGIVFVIPHPKYQALSSGYLNDIALVKLKKKIKFSQSVAPVSLPSATDSFSSSSDCWITGWGNIGTHVPLPDPETLQQLKIPIISQTVCKAKYPELTDDMLCAGDMAGGKDACKGDYGGPLVCRAAGQFVQVGIMSYGSGDGCALPGSPGIYTQVSKYLRFINSYINHSEEASDEV